MAYPVALSLGGRHCIVAGFGNVGRRKLAGLLAANVGSVLVLDIRAPEALGAAARSFLADARVTFERREFAETDLPCFLLFAATSDPAANRKMAHICAARGILCNCATNPEDGSFTLPAVARAGDVCVALSTRSPYLGREWKKELQKWLDGREAPAALAIALRPLLLKRPDSRALLGQIARGPLARFQASRDLEQCRRELLALLPENEPELNEIFTSFTAIGAEQCSPQKQPLS